MVIRSILILTVVTHAYCGALLLSMATPPLRGHKTTKNNKHFIHLHFLKQQTSTAPSSQGISRRVLQSSSANKRRHPNRSASGNSTDSSAPESLNNDRTGLELSEFHRTSNGARKKTDNHGPFKRIGNVVAILDDPSLQMGRLIVLAASAIYGTNFATVKLLDDALPLSVSATLRFGLASTVVSMAVLGKEADDVDPIILTERNLALWAGMEIGLWYCIGYIAQAEGLQTVEAGKSAFFNSLAVVVVPILDVIFKGKVLRTQQIGAVALSCVGVGLLELGPTGLRITPGDLMAFAQTIFFGIGYWRLEAVSHAHPKYAARITVGLLGAVAVGAAIYALTEFSLGHVDASLDDFVTWFQDPFIVGSLFWTGLISTALALYLETVALKVVSASELTLLMTTVSLWGAAFAFVTIGEVLSPTGLVGGLLILGGCVLGNVAPAKSQPVLPMTRSSDNE